MVPPSLKQTGLLLTLPGWGPSLYVRSIPSPLFTSLLSKILLLITYRPFPANMLDLLSMGLGPGPGLFYLQTPFPPVALWSRPHGAPTCVPSCFPLGSSQDICLGWTLPPHSGRVLMEQSKTRKCHPLPLGSRVGSRAYCSQGKASSSRRMCCSGALASGMAEKKAES